MGNISSNKRSAEEMERGSVQENVDVTTSESSAAAAAQETAAANESSTNTAVPAFIDAATTQETVAVAVPAIIASPAASTAASSVAAASAIDTEEVLGSVVYLLTFLGFFAWLMKECRDKTAYVKTACSRIAEFLQFTGNSPLYPKSRVACLL
jgi:hypothetical protein